MFSLIRVSLYALMTALAVILVRKQKRKLIKVITVAVLLALMLTVSLFPVENLFYRFASPEDAFNYQYESTVVCQNVIPGQDCALVFGQEKVYATRKSGDGWKLQRGFDLQTKSEIREKGVFLTLYTVRGTSDVFVLVMADREISVSDNLGSDFTRLSDYWETGFVAYCVPVSATVGSYAVIIDGTEYAVNLN